MSIRMIATTMPLIKSLAKNLSFLLGRVCLLLALGVSVVFIVLTFFIVDICFLSLCPINEHLAWNIREGVKKCLNVRIAQWVFFFLWRAILLPLRRYFSVNDIISLL